MELRQLKYFVRTCECLNFTEASRSLNISQSTLSQQIKQLETELDTLLFDRIGKKIRITEAGEALLPYARNCIRESENGKQIISDLQRVETGVLNIGVTYSLSAVLSAVLSRFSDMYPKVHINITYATSSELMNRLENNDMDFVLSFGVDRSDMDMERDFLFSSRLYFVASASHPLASRAAVRLDEVSSVPLILPGVGFATRDIIEKAASAENIELRAQIEINDVDTIKDMVSYGRYATILSYAAVRNEENLSKIAIMSRQELSISAFLFWNRGLYRKKAALLFSDLLFQMVGK